MKLGPVLCWLMPALCSGMGEFIDLAWPLRIKCFMSKMEDTLENPHRIARIRRENRTQNVLMVFILVLKLHFK